MNRFVSLIVAAIFAASLNTAFAAEDTAAVEKRLRASLAVLLPNLVPDTISPTPLKDIYEVTFGNRIVYLSGDGRYLLQGKMIDLETRAAITDDRLQGLKKAAVDSLDESQMIIYGDKTLKYTVTVFTDIDCGYCRKLHSQVADYNKNGIRIRYLAYPRAGLNSSSARDAISVWCADDRHKAMDTAKSGGRIQPKTCDNPVAEHYQLGQSFGISGTPALVLETGEVIPGYVPPARLAAVLKKKVDGSKN